jgi:hypothetical protein
LSIDFFIFSQQISGAIAHNVPAVYDGLTARIEKCGYKKWGHLPKIAIIDNVEVGHLYYGKRIIP